ncbi:uncharacterized protein LOC6568030 isoform X2 [Drosophila grimshawi]|uniref:uncharacterized protein LOC6568030 isoform X2 n=1 Tax=Drosophila grimshawi TaxID=7222 RepID=UPI000C86F47E|nr:uncharacterized protein LOC6568030 isoform X2 [Drosophila grimshawi]
MTLKRLLKHLDSDRGAQIRCVLQVLQDSKYCLMIALLLPKLLAKPSSLVEALTGTEYEPALKLVADYVRRRDTIVQEQRHPLYDDGMIKIINYFQRHPQIRQLFPDYEMTPQDNQLLFIFEQMFQIALSHLKRTAKHELASEHKLHKLYKGNEEVKKNIDELLRKLSRRKVQLRWIMAARTVFVQKCEMKMSVKKAQYAKRILNESENCQSIIRKNRKKCLERIKVLETELQSLRANYEQQAKRNRRVEMRTRQEKNKLELQLQSAINKYDHTIGERMIEHLDLENEFEGEQKSMETLVIAYHKEEKNYKNIVTQHEEGLNNNMKSKINLYMMNRAARKIQNYWREWRTQLNKEMRSKMIATKKKKRNTKKHRKLNISHRNSS